MIKRRPNTMTRQQSEKQEIDAAVMDRAKRECDFTDRLYDILIEFQKWGCVQRKIKSAAMGNIGELDMTHSQLYNAIWDAALNVGVGRAKHKTSTRENKPRKGIEHDNFKPDTLSIDSY